MSAPDLDARECLGATLGERCYVIYDSGTLAWGTDRAFVLDGAMTEGDAREIARDCYPGRAAVFSYRVGAGGRLEDERRLAL